MVDQITALNPRPMKLKFEKVYLPSVLQTKKRYVGFKYEHLSETEPVFDAKGIETVRRDGCPAVGKTLEKSLKYFLSVIVLIPPEFYLEQRIFHSSRNTFIVNGQRFCWKEYRFKISSLPRLSN